jgi:LysM repeat protein
MTQKPIALFFALALLTLSSPLLAQTLKGSRESMQRQHQEALKYGYSFLKTPGAVVDFVNQGHLVKINANANIELHDVSYPYARTEVKMFVDRLSGQYRSVCNERLMVTSLTRPINRQPSNAANDSVHPTGMAVDLRIPGDGKCRSWLEKTLLSLESTGVLDVTRERNPAHYHVAVFTRTYENYVTKLENLTPAPVPTPASLSTVSTPSAISVPKGEHVVRLGDTLALIAERNGTTIAKLRSANGIRGSLIHAGQKLAIPGAPVSEKAGIDNALPQALAVNTNNAAPMIPEPAMMAAAATSIPVEFAEIETAQVASTVAAPLTAPNATTNSPTTTQTAAVPTKSKIKSSKTSSKKNSKQTLKLASNEVTHKVRRGDTLWDIANRYGADLKALKKTNGLKGNTLQPGQVLRIR